MMRANAPLDTVFHRPLIIGGRTFSSNLIQGPLAGFSCAPFRELFYQFAPPAFAVSEMISAHDVLNKHKPNSRYLARSSIEKNLCYQLSGSDPTVLAEAAVRLQDLGADLIDLNCGCPKAKIRKKGAGSALLDSPKQLLSIVEAMCARMCIPLTVKIRIQNDESDILLAQNIEKAGASALIVHGRRWVDDYDKPCNYEQIAKIKSLLNIPVIANGDIQDKVSLHVAFQKTECDGYMISRAGSGKPWLYQQLLQGDLEITDDMRRNYFMMHIAALGQLEQEYSAVLQSKALARYYFKHQWTATEFQSFYRLETLLQIEQFLFNFVR